MKKFPRDVKKVEGLKLQLSLGESLRRMRKCAHVSQEELASLIAIHQTALSRVESGQQNLLPWQLQQISEFFGVGVDSLLVEEINYWAIAERFNRTPPFPAQYRTLPFSKTREILPTLFFMESQKGVPFREKTLEGLGIDSSLLKAPDQTIGANCQIDLFRSLINTQVLTENTLSKLVTETRQEKVQGILHTVYQSHDTSISLAQSWALNARLYDGNFSYEILDLANDRLELSIKPLEHMRGLKYKDETLGDVFCRYKKEYLSQFPHYIGQPALSITERECHYHGAARCVYHAKVA